MKDEEKEEIAKSIMKSTNLYRNMIHSFNESDLNRLVVIGMNNCSRYVDMIGKVVQVRLEAGAFGSDSVFLRRADGSLGNYENQSFHPLSGDELKKAMEMFTDVEIDTELTFTICNENEKTGFIVPSEVSEGQSTPMRDIKNALMCKIAETLEDKSAIPGAAGNCSG